MNNYSTFKLVLLVLLLCHTAIVCGQNSDSTGTEYREFWKTSRPVMQAVRIETPPKIDGQPNDACWAAIAAATDFVMHQPRPYARATFNSQFRIAYDDNALYAIAYLYDPSPDSIRREVGVRDNVGVAADYVNLSLDTYNDDQNAFRFGTTAAGVQFDSRLTDGQMNNNGMNADFSWDAVWESSVSLQKDGWVVEWKIPFSALRFATKDIQTWGINLTRGINRLAEENTWSGIDPKVNGIAIQYGSLTGLEGIKPPLRLQFSPYLAAVEQRSPSYNNSGDVEKYLNQTQFTGGLDLKYGINESFTLDMTLIPNFGQVQSDNRVLNLGPFEVQFNENRPFFTEGAEIFRKGDLFYSRRIGGTPNGYWSAAAGDNEIIKNNPVETQLYNATKISGRTNKNLAIGMLNAVTAPMYATYKNTITGEERREQTAVLTNYNILSLSQTLKNNSEVSFTNATTVRDGDERDAIVSSLFTRLRDKKSRYEFFVDGKLSQIFEPATGPKRGFNTTQMIQKISGNWGWNIGQQIQDNRWDPNDMGIFFGNNNWSHFAGFNYNQVEPNKVFLQSNWWVNVNRSMQYNTRHFQDAGINWGFWGKFKNQWSANWWSYTQPIWTYDFFEPRVAGKQFNVAPFYNTGININSDERKKLASYLFLGGNFRDLPGHRGLQIMAEPRYRVNNKLSISAGLWYNPIENEIGFADIQGDKILFGTRDRRSVETSLSSKYAFSNKINLTFRARHYWSKVNYDNFFTLNDDGGLTPLDFVENHDRNIDFFNIDLIYTQQFAPGSFINVIWKNNITNWEEGEAYIIKEDYFGNVGKTFNSPQVNSLTVKVIYFLDYQTVHQKLKKQKPG